MWEIVGSLPDAGREILTLSKWSFPRKCQGLSAVLNKMYIGLEVNCLLSTIIYNLSRFFLTDKLSDSIKGVSEYIAFSANGERTGKG